MLNDRSAHISAALNGFLSRPLHETLRQHLATDPRTSVLQLFHRAARDVPAYRRFLEEHGVDPGEIASFENYQRLPLIDKAGYMRAYPLPERCWGGRIAACERMAVSSGSTGAPMFWPRSLPHELDVASRFEQAFHDSFGVHERTTLAVVCFALGNWVGGMYTASGCWLLAQKGYPVTVVTPGNKMDEIFRVVRELAPFFEQTVLLGYPPFVKDVIDAGIQEGIDWSRHRIKMIFAGEVFSEEWRNLVTERVGADSPCYDTVSLYGTADGGVLGNETPLSIAIRRFLAQHPATARELFGESRLPTLVQYDPISRFFETHEGTLVVSGDNGVPLVRYHIADKGGIIGHAEMRQFLQKQGVSSFRDLGVEADPCVPLPFVYVFGRADFTVSYYGANIFPENVTVGLEQPDISRWITGKFVLEVRQTPAGDSCLSVTVELLPGQGADPEKERRIAESIEKELLRLNSEFVHYVPADRRRVLITLRSFEDIEYFPPGVKHRYSRR
jgi:phenylacetate-CoA ligase